jgi:hypothetical protein
MVHEWTAEVLEVAEAPIVTEAVVAMAVEADRTGIGCPLADAVHGRCIVAEWLEGRRCRDLLASTRIAEAKVVGLVLQQRKVAAVEDLERGTVVVVAGRMEPEGVSGGLDLSQVKDRNPIDLWVCSTKSLARVHTAASAVVGRRVQQRCLVLSSMVRSMLRSLFVSKAMCGTLLLLVDGRVPPA